VKNIVFHVSTSVYASVLKLPPYQLLVSIIPDARSSIGYVSDFRVARKDSNYAFSYVSVPGSSYF